MYNFRIEFELYNDARFDYEKSGLKLLSSNENIVYTLSPTDRKNSSGFIIEGFGFSTEEKAREGENKARNALIWYCGKFYSGVKFKGATMTFTEVALKKMSDASGVRVLNYKARGNVYSDDKPTVFMSGSAKGFKVHQVKYFSEIFQQGLNIKLNDKEYLGFELYNACSFESSIRAKFLTLIIAIESLLDRPLRNNKVVEYIESLKERTKKQKELDNDIISLVSCLGELKYQSILSRSLSENTN